MWVQNEQYFLRGCDSLYRTTTLAESPWASLEEMRFTRDVQLLAHSCYFIRPRVRWCMNSRQPVGLAVSLKTKTVQSKCQSLNLYPIKTIVTNEWTHVLNKRHPCSFLARKNALLHLSLSPLTNTHTRGSGALPALSLFLSLWLAPSLSRTLGARAHTLSTRSKLITRTHHAHIGVKSERDILLPGVSEELILNPSR